MVTSSLGSAMVRNVIQPLWAMRDHPKYRHYLIEFNRSQYFTKEQLAELQRVRVHALLDHAYQHCRFYRDRIEDAGLKQSDFEDKACLESLPRLTKSDIQRNMSAMLADNVAEADRSRNQTGGSTGAPLQFYVDKERLDSRMASTERHDAWAGFRPGDWCAYLWGARLDLLGSAGTWQALKNHLLYRRVELNTSKISESDWRQFLAQIRKFKPEVMVAYAQSAVLFANYVLEHDIKDIEFRTMITSAEILFPEQRKLLEETFGGKVFNRYGCREVSVIASECERHAGLHVNADALLVEVIKGEGAEAPLGKLLITDLFNRSQPLIRYEIEDIGRWAEMQDCPCGRKLPLLADLQGRSTDFLLMPDGQKISGPSLTLVIADVKELQHMQIVQESAEEIILRCVPGVGWSSDVENVIRKRLALYLHPVIRTKVELCTELEISVSGKHRFVINRMTQANERAGVSK